MADEKPELNKNADETAFLNAYDNDFSHNLINSVADRMSSPPIIRIGGTSGYVVL